jgi:hypothetical protein
MIIEKNIHKFITHIVNNLFPLNEYQEGEIKLLMNKFKQEAEDLNIEINDTLLRKYIERFDQLKDSSKIEDKNLRNYPLSKLIKLVTSSKGADVEDEETGPDVLYSENGITVYSGANEELCQRHRSEVPWCITNSAFGNYRYSKDRGFPSFYLIKNDTDEYRDNKKLSFVAIQVRDGSFPSNKKYIWTPKDNDPNESEPMGWSKLTSNIPWLTQIPNIENILKYIPLSSTEKATQLYGKDEITIREWSNLPFEIKKQYLVIRKELKILFEDITIDEFVSKYLPKYPQIATFVATNAGVIEPKILVKNLDKFSNNDRKSIIKNLRESFRTDELSKDFFPFDVKLLLTKLKKWNLGSDERIYITKNNEAIIRLRFTSGDVQMGVFTAEDEYPNVKLNTRTSKYLLDYPEIDKIPFNTLIKLTNDEAIDKNFIEKVIVKAEEDPNSAIVVKNVEDGKILLDSNSFTSYKIKDGKISSIPFNDEEVQKVLNTETENTGFQESAVNIVFQQTDISPSIDKDAFINILKNTPYDKRTKDSTVILINDSETGNPIFAMPTEIPLNIKTSFSYGGGGTWNNYWKRTQNLDEDTIKPYFNYLRSKNVGFNDETLIRWLDSSYTGLAKKIISLNPPMDPNSIYYPAVIEDKYVLINKSNPSASKAIGKNKIIRANVPPNIAREITGVGAEQTPRAPRTPRSAAPQAAVAPNATVNAALDFNRLTAGFNSLPTSIKSRIGGGDVVPYNRRNASVDAIGRVRTFIQNGQSKFYIIRLNSGTIIGFATMQPDARHYIVTSTTSYQVPRVGQLASVLQQRNISEGTKTALRMHASAYPEEANEIKKILQKLKIK